MVQRALLPYVLLLPALLLPVLGGLGCGGAEPVPDNPGGRVEAVDDDERSILAEIERLPTGEQTTLGATTVVAEEPYRAASGNTCRWLSLTTRGGASARRLACSDGASWFFAPDVLGPPIEVP